jgi:hypothetical protein
MKCLKYALLSVLFVAGCAYNQYQGDIAYDQFNEKQTFADSSAAYVGEWTGGSALGIRSIKIREDGKIKVCMSPSAGTMDGKVYLENGEPAIIMKTGAKAKFISMNKDALLLEIYGKQEKYYAGLVPEECVPAFVNFR